MRPAILIVVVMVGALAGRTTIGQSRDQGDWFLNDVHVPRNLVPGAIQKPIVIAIVDDAFRLTHRGLSDLLWTNPREIPGNRIDDDGNGHVDDVHGWDVSDDDGDVGAPANRTDLYHGTHLAGIIAAVVRTAYGDAAPRVVRIMPIKSLADYSPTTTLLTGYAGIEYAVAAGADIILCSWGVGQIAPRESRILQDAADKGILVVASGGNFPEERDQFPAAHAAVLAISATDQGGHKVVNANFGQFIDLAAPGVAIRSASAASDNGEEVHDGTGRPPPPPPRSPSAHAHANIDQACHDATRLIAAAISANWVLPGAASPGAASSDTPPINRLVQTKGFKMCGVRAPTIRWTIAPPGEFAGIRFTPITGQARSARGRIEFRASPAADAPVIASHALDALPATIYVAGGGAYVTFIPERDAPPLDWLLKYESAAIDFRTLYCRGTKEVRTEGVLTDGSGPENYSAGTDCRWHIIAPAGKVIRFHVDEFDTEPKVDQVQFFNGS